MKTVHNYSIENETYEEQSKAGRFNPAMVMTYRDKKGKHRITLSAGRSDDIHVLRESSTTYILNVNDQLDYACLAQYEEGEKMGEIFVQDITEIRKDLLELSPITITKTLSEYIF